MVVAASLLRLPGVVALGQAILAANTSREDVHTPSAIVHGNVAHGARIAYQIEHAAIQRDSQYNQLPSLHELRQENRAFNRALSNSIEANDVNVKTTMTASLPTLFGFEKDLQFSNKQIEPMELTNNLCQQSREGGISGTRSGQHPISTSAHLATQFHSLMKFKLNKNYLQEINEEPGLNIDHLAGPKSLMGDTADTGHGLLPDQSADGDAKTEAVRGDDSSCRVILRPTPTRGGRSAVGGSRHLLHRPRPLYSTVHPAILQQGRR